MRTLVPGLALLVASLAVTAATPDLAQIMAEPDWIGPAIERPAWSADGRQIHYRLKREGSPVRDLWRLDLATGETARVADAELAEADGDPLPDRDGTHAAFLRDGNVFVRDLRSGELRQLLRAAAPASDLQWSADGRALQFRIGQDWHAADLASGALTVLALPRAEDEPDARQPDALTREQLRLFDALRMGKAQRDERRARELELDRADASRRPRPFRLGKNVRIVASALAPDGRHLLVVTEPAEHKEGKAPRVHRYVTDSGYGEDEDTRIYVGRDAPAPQDLWLLDLSAHAAHKLALEPLPGVRQDPLKSLRAARQRALRAAGQATEADALAAPAIRPVRIADEGESGIAWSEDGQAVVVRLRAIDNKDRWLASVDLARHALVPQHRLQDSAWINWNFNEFGFVPGSRTLWYLSEESGYSQLYVKPLAGKARQLTRGSFEVSRPQLSPDGRWFYLRANREAPYAYDVYRLPTTGGELERVSRVEGLDGFRLSPDAARIAIVHSGPYLPPQLAVVDADGGNFRELTDTRSEAWRALSWIEPEFVTVPSTHGRFAIHAKLYRPAGEATDASRPAVLFVHGAGYTQNVKSGWSYYFREQMFHSLLVAEGYVVLDMDYRASEGYGRDWRTAIYRQMGHPELEDLLDGKAWLVANHGVDPGRVGIYGGSYGGFMILMALLRAPGEFAAGAALRPVTDWRAYNHEYTSNILNTPQLDPEAYATSSPIEFAAGLADPLLIAHGLIDDNVLPDDSLRLYQRFIELRKHDFWLSLYPVERHAFTRADSWHDEFRRIHELFTRYLQPATAP